MNGIIIEIMCGATASLVLFVLSKISSWLKDKYAAYKTSKTKEKSSYFVISDKETILIG